MPIAGFRCQRPYVIPDHRGGDEVTNIQLDPNERDDELEAVHEELESDMALLSYVETRLDKALAKVTLKDTKDELEGLKKWTSGRRNALRAEAVRLRTPDA